MRPAGDMLKVVLLLIAVAGLNARPLQHNDLRIQNGGWVVGAPQLVQNGQENMENPRQDPESGPQWEVVLAPEQTRADMNQNVEMHRQGTEPSKRFVVDLDTGLLKEYIVYNPASNPKFRQGTQNSRVTLVDIRTGQLLPQLSEMQRRTEPLSQFRQGTEYSEPNLLELRKNQKAYNPASNPKFRQGTQDSHATLVDIRTGQQLPQLSEMQRRAEPLSQFRQGTEYSETNLMEHRKDQKSYNPASNAEFRQGTQNSRVTLVDTRTGQLLPQLSEMQRRTEPLSQFRQGTEYSETNLMELRKNQKSYNPASNAEFRQGTQNSRVTLVDTRTGQLLPQLSEMQRRTEPLSQFRQGTEYSEPILLDLRKNQKSYNPASNPKFRQGTQDSRATLVDIRTGQQLPQLSEMQRRAEPLSQFRQGTEYSETNLMELRKNQKSYNPASNAEFRQGTQDSRVTLVDTRTGQLLPQLSEMQRSTEPLKFKQGTEYNLVDLMNFRKTQISKALHSVQDLETNEVFPEFKRGIAYSQDQRRHVMAQRRVQALESNEVDISSPVEEFRRGLDYSQANVIDRRFMVQNEQQYTAV